MIRLATDADQQYIIDIYNQAIPSRMATADLEPVTVADRANWFANHDAQAPLWVYEQDNQIIAWLSLEYFSRRRGYRKAREVSLYVDNAYQHQGLGQALYNHMLTKLGSLKVDTILALIFYHNEASISFFKKQGFQDWGLYPNITEMDAERRTVCVLGWQRIDDK